MNRQSLTQLLIMKKDKQKKMAGRVECVVGKVTNCEVLKQRNQFLSTKTAQPKKKQLNVDFFYFFSCCAIMEF